MNDLHDIRRRDNGIIDVDFYRAGAAALRRQAMHDASRPRAALAVGVVIAIMLGFAAISRLVPEQQISTLQRQAEILRSRIDALSTVDPELWPQFHRVYPGSRQTLIADLQRQLIETEGSINRIRIREQNRRAAVAPATDAPQAQ